MDQKNLYPVNSRDWWEQYFAEEWEGHGGPAQTRYFMQRLVAELPIPEASYLRTKPLSILDCGCAFGEGVELLAQSFPHSRTIGLDFSATAIEQARRRYSDRLFILAEDGEITDEVDVIVSSNCLEHFEYPLEIVRRHLQSCRDLYILLVPYNEFPLCEYHRSQFKDESFPSRLGTFTRICARKIDIDPVYWQGNQLLVIYGSQTYLRERISFAHKALEQEKWNEYYASLPISEGDQTTRAFGTELVQHLSELLPAGGRILEAGCGGGWQSLALARSGRFQVSLMDFSREALEYARQVFEREKLKAEFIDGDVFTQGEPQFDLVFNAGVLEHYTLEQQGAFLRGMATRSRNYVLALVPNRSCYWYWIWRLQKSGTGQWPFGKEMPLADFSTVFEAAGLQFLGQTFMGQEWTESFISSLDQLNQQLCEEILKVHRSPLVPKKLKSYLLAGLGSVLPDTSKVPGSWKPSTALEDTQTAEMQAALADALALGVAAEHRVAKLQSSLIEKQDELSRKAQELTLLSSQAWEAAQDTRVLSAQLAAKDRQLALILSSRSWRMVEFYARLKHQVLRAAESVPSLSRTALSKGKRLALRLTGGTRFPSAASQRSLSYLFDIEKDRKEAKRVCIVTPAFFDMSGTVPYFGGAERYLYELTHVLRDMGYQPEIYQPAKGDWVRYFRDLSITGLDTDGDGARMNDVFHRRVPEPCLTIYLAFFLAAPKCFQPSVGISHGIYWDHELSHSTPKHLRDTIRSVLDCFENLRTVVSVDTNTINWVRTTSWSLSEKFHYIPNFVDLSQFHPGPSEIKRRSHEVVVLFPRRLYGARGFWLVTEVMPHILCRYPEAVFHIVGQANSGREREFMERALKEYPGRIKWEILPPDRMHEAYWSADISIIPTLHSEGTSLSCLEAMASGNAVIATDVGGLPNILLHRHNGLLIRPQAGELLDAIDLLIKDSTLRSLLSERAIETAQAFDLSHWRTKWHKLLSTHLTQQPRHAVRKLQRPPRTLVVENPSIEWSRMKQRPHYIAEQFAEAGWEVFWRQPTKATDPPMRHLHFVSTDDALYADFPFLYIFYPFDYDRISNYRKPIVIYDVVDDISIHDESDKRAGLAVGKRARDYNEKLLQRADIVMTSSHALFKKLVQIRPDTSLVPNGVDLVQFNDDQLTDRALPHDLSTIARPRIGFHGAIAEWFDADLVEKLVRVSPQYQFVFIGPVTNGKMNGLAKLPNCHFLGEKPPESIPQYLAEMDVSILPFLINPTTRGVRPLKVLESLAMRCPVVASPLPELKGWPYVFLAADQAQFQEGIKTALEVSHKMQADDNLSQFLRANSWQTNTRRLLFRMNRVLMQASKIASTR